MGSLIMNCVDFCLILQVENNFELMGQTLRLMQLALEYLNARALVLSLFIVYVNDLPKAIEHCTVAIILVFTFGASRKTFLWTQLGDYFLTP